MLRACLRGNLILPQTYEGGAIFLAEASIDRRDELQLANVLCPEQIKRMRRSMEAAHALRWIPAGGTAYLDAIEGNANINKSRSILIDDSRLQYIWSRFWLRAVEIVSALPGGSAGADIAKGLVQKLLSQELRSVLAEYRSQYDRRAEGSDQWARNLRSKILRELVACVGSGADRLLLERVFFPNGAN